MKISIGLYILFLFVSCKNQSAYTEIPDLVQDSIYYPYSPSYTGGYRLGNNKKLKIVADIWKEFENGDIRKTADDFADEINYVTPTLVIRGKKDSVLTEVKKIRDSYKSLQTFVYSWMPVKSSEQNEDWVFIWGKQVITDKEDKMQILEIHEIWQFNDDGKIKYVQQYNTRNK